SALMMINFKNIVVPSSKRSNLNRKFNPSKPSGKMNTYPTLSFKMMSSKVHSLGVISWAAKKRRLHHCNNGNKWDSNQQNQNAKLNKRNESREAAQSCERI
ncbi:MAG: hypothetical protein LUQ30_05810, partial [Methanothrix sp.]|nr:hypothetical protein [Methanothrix sp.]